MTDTIDSLTNKINNLICVKKKKRPPFRIAVNEWLAQTIIDDQWGSAYFTNPPNGMPAVLHDSIQAAIISSMQKAIALWEESQKSKSNEG